MSSGDSLRVLNKDAGVHVLCVCLCVKGFCMWMHPLVFVCTHRKSAVLQTGCGAQCHIPFALANGYPCTLPHTRSHEHLHTQTHKHEFLYPLGNVWWIKTKVNQSSLCTQTPNWLKQIYRHSFFMTIISIFLLVLGVCRPCRWISWIVFSHWVFTRLTVFDIQKDSWGGGGCWTNVHKQHKQKRYKIFMQLKQGWKVQCKQIS